MWLQGSETGARTAAYQTETRVMRVFDWCLKKTHLTDGTVLSCSMLFTAEELSSAGAATATAV